MGINDFVVYIMMTFMIVAGLDRCLFTLTGKSLRLYDKFEEGFNAMGPLALAMVSAICVAPVLAAYLRPVVSPVYELFGASPAMFATTLIACDMGGYALAMELAGPGNQEIGKFAGVILGSMMGPTIVFCIPVALGIIKAQDRKFLAQGILIGMTTIPLGCFIGGMVQGLPALVILINLIPVIIVAFLIILGLTLMPLTMIKLFNCFGKFIICSITLVLIAICVETLTGTAIVVHIASDGTVTKMASLYTAIDIIGDIAIILAGAFPLVYVLTRYFKKGMLTAGNCLGVNSIAAAGFIASLANTIPMFVMMKDMDNRGKVINVAFAVSGAFILGDHLGFVAGVERDMIFAMTMGKLAGGFSAIGLAAFLLSKKRFQKILQN